MMPISPSRTSNIGQIEGTITNTGTIALESTGGFTTLSIEGDTTLTGSGAVQMNNQANNRIIGIHRFDPDPCC